MTSAFPKTVDELVPAAQQLARDLGRMPSRNRVMATLNIGAPKASAVLAALTGFDPTAPGPDPNPAGPDTRPAAGPAGQPPRRLHAVTDTATGTDPTGPDPVDPDPTGPASTTPTITPTSGPADHHTDRLPLFNAVVDPGVTTAGRADLGRFALVRVWPLVLLALPAFVAIWSGWVGLGQMCGFGPVHPLPGIAPGFALNTAITLPIGMETYAAYALRVWLSVAGSTRARRFARTSAIASLVLGASGQIAYHLMTAAHATTAPWPITMLVACLPVLVLGFGAALAHLQHTTPITESARTEALS